MVGTMIKACPIEKLPNRFSLGTARCWLFSLALSISALAWAASDWPVFEGAWFTVAYPPSFTPRPSLPSPSRGEGYDSVRFVGPDGAVAFYVFAPQWGGDPVDIRPLEGKERLAEESRTEKGLVVVRWYRYERLDKAWFRSYQDKTDSLSNTRVVIGMEYRGREEYSMWRGDYERFKQSLVQYAD
jgi:hypothetical protein